MFGIADNAEFLKDIGIANASDEDRQAAISKIEELAKKKLIIKMSERIGEDKAEEFAQIDDDEESYRWLLTNMPDFESIVGGIIEEIKDEVMKAKMGAEE